MEGEREYPEDLQAALDRVYETARPFSDSEVSALRAALNIALAHLTKAPEPGPDVIVMLVEAGSVTPTRERWWDDDSPMIEVTFASDVIITVCPSCLCTNGFTYFEDGTEYRKFYDEDLAVSEDSENFYQSDGANGVGWGLLCQGCSTRCSVPDWLYEAGFMPGDSAGEWGGAA